jgi:sterol desaturase/sphingolipid hydroxylase (fatty acid hydroxylase superfamily)
MRLFERRWPLEKGGDERLVGVDRVYTALNKLGVIPLIVFVVAYPVTTEIEHLVRAWGFVPPRLERLLPWLGDNALASFLVYFALYDCAAYWVHRAQHRFSWWWALHSLHHSQRRVTVWSDDRNHVLDDLLVTLVLVVFSQIVGVQPDDYVLILMVGRLIESWSHANVDMSFGRIGEKLIVGPRFHRLHHALASPAERHIHDHNFAPVFPIWDILFGTAIYDHKRRPTGVDDPLIDADNGRGWLAQQVSVFGRFIAAITSSFRGIGVTAP